MKLLNNLIKKRIVFLDGATGTELQKLGMPQGACPENWCIKNPNVISKVHQNYQQAGSDIVYTCTFGANRYKLSQYGIKNVKKINRDLAHIARKSVRTKILVAGDVGPTGKFVEPFGPISFEKMVSVFKEQVSGLLEGGVDLITIETMMDIQEARAALIAAKELTKKPVFVTMTFEKDGRTLNGTDAITALGTLQSLGADAVGCNCSAGPKEMVEFIRAMHPFAKVPLIAKPNAGMPRLLKGQTVFTMNPKDFSSEGKKLALSGVSILGGCCGTTPEHIRELYKKTFSLKPPKPTTKPITLLTSARGHVSFKKKQKPLIIGECINPTGRKVFREELQKNKIGLVRQFAREQEQYKADLLDVNVGAPGVNEEKLIVEVINLLSVSTKCPLVIDSSKIKAVENALRIYPGRALINSISGEKEKIKKLLSIAAKYGAMFILLPVAKDVPQTFVKRKRIILDIFKKAKIFGFSKSDIVVDGLVMAVSSLPNAGVETLKTISWCAEKFGVASVVGLSNVSFGMPHRELINSTFYFLLEKQGLSTVIANPMKLKRKHSKKAEKLLLGKDKDALEFIGYYSNKKLMPLKIKKEKDIPLDKKIYQAVLEGNREEIKGFVHSFYHDGCAAEKIVQELMIPAINKVGELFDQKKYFLPQLVSSAETMKIAFEYLEPMLKEKNIKDIKKTIVILATVKGDIHDIGKNIVALMLRNHGFNVIDLGKNVSSERIVAEIKRHKSSIVGLSALMTTTMINMKDVVQKARTQGLNCRFMVGGAVVTRSYAKILGAAYSKDGVEAVRVAKELTH